MTIQVIWVYKSLNIKGIILITVSHIVNNLFSMTNFQNLILILLLI